MKRLVVAILVLIVLVLSVAQVKAMRRPSSGAAGDLAGGAVRHRVGGGSTGDVRVAAEGRLVAYPGAEVTVGTDVAGTIEKLTVEEKDHVKKGQVIAVIKADDTRAALGTAKARVGEADADIRLAESERERFHKLWLDDVGSKQAYQKSERDLDAARARKLSAIAEVRRLEALVEKTVITAPIDGVVIERIAHAGETVADGAPLITIANLEKTRVEAEVDEFDASRVKLGAPAFLKAEGYEGEWKGTIEEIPDAVTSRRIKPQDPSKPIDTRVLLVKIALDEAVPMKLGQRVEVQIAVR